MDSRHFLVRRARWSEHRIVTAPRLELVEGEAELEINRFGLTANNATYAALGDAMSYWHFFPTDREGWGRVPVWGFGSVARSRAAGVQVGERFYGFFPMSTHLVVSPARADEAGFLDGAAHRRPLNGVYNQYLRANRDPNYTIDSEPWQVVLRPLFATSFFLADFLETNDFFGAETLLISSASSKLAYGTAFLLSEAMRRKGRDLVGLTSARNLDFVTGLALYHRVLTYRGISELPRARTAVFVDVAGNTEVRAAVHGHFGDALKYSCAIGAAHGQGSDTQAPPDGPRPVVFFAPSWIKERTKVWTPAGTQERLANEWKAFLAVVRARDWLKPVLASGGEAVARAYDDIIAGRGKPGEGYVLSL